jgi:PAS domain S-box-containing protein
MSDTTYDESRLSAAEQGLADREAYVRLLLDSTAESFYAVDTSGLTTLCNPAFLKLMGFASEAEAVGRRLHDIIHHSHPDGSHYEANDCPIYTCARDGTPAHVVGEIFFRVDGTPVEVEYWAHPIRLGGEQKGAICTFFDVTERVAAEARRLALVELGDRVGDLAEPAEIAYMAAEILGRTLKVDRAGYGTIDVVRETIRIDRSWTAPGVGELPGELNFRDYGTYIDELKRGETVVVTDAETDPRTVETAEALKAITAHSFVNMPVTEHGGFVALLYLNHGMPRTWCAEELAFIRDFAVRTRTLVERSRAERELRELAASLELRVAERTRERDMVWRTSRDLICICDEGGIYRSVNPAWTAVLEYEMEDLIGQAWNVLVHPDDLPRLHAVCIPADEAVVFENLDIRLRAKKGEYRWFSWTCLRAGNGYYCSGRDVTERKMLEDQLRQSQKMEAVGQLTGGLAHDFNNLLAGISGSVELLGTRIAQGRFTDLERYVATAQSAAKRAAALTHRLLAFSRRQTLDPRPTNVNRLAADMEEIIRRAVGPTIEIEMVGAAGLWTALVDPNQLENALLNLCLNARDAMPDGGRITIETSNKWMDERAARERELPPGQYLTLCVTDTGSGMTPEVAARAFDPFFTTKPMGQGTGLGLSMIYGFVRQSGGQVRIYSELGHGTTMCLYLPRYVGDEDISDEAPPPAASVRAAQGETVLVVDDEPMVRMLVVEVLEEMGYIAIEADDGAAGLKVLQTGARVDLLVTDVGLPGGMNGRQMADAGRVIRPDLKVLFITGYAENAAIGNGYLEHGMHVITKPFAMDALAAKIQELISEG